MKLNTKIKLRSKGYPYTYARISVMRRNLLPRNEYHKLMKMKVESIARYLEESSYKSAIDKEGLRYRGADLIEHSLNVDLVNTFIKLRRISPPEVRILIDTYAGRWDMYNIKTVIRGIYSKADKNYIKSLLIPAGLLDEMVLDELLKKESVENIIRSTRILKLEKVKDALRTLSETRKLVEIENKLDQIYYENCLLVAKRLGHEGKLFRKFLMMEIDIINIRNILRMKREKFDKKECMSYIIFSGEKLKKGMLEKLAALESVESVVEELKKTNYGELLKNTQSSLIDAELELDRYLIKRSFLYTHQYPMSVMSILAFMLGKIMEVKNLKTIAKAKQLGIEESIIEEKLVVV
ncbi:MAG: ATP synthase A1 subunit C [Candidatus Woesearchaeota archaeon]